MKTLVVFAALVVMVAASPMLGLTGGQFVVTKDFSWEDGHEYDVKYVKPYTPGKGLPMFPYNMDSSEEMRYFLASGNGQKPGTWAERVKKLQHVLDTGVDADDYYRLATLPADHQYYMDASGDVYYLPNHQKKTY